MPLNLICLNASQSVTDSHRQALEDHDLLVMKHFFNKDDLISVRNELANWGTATNAQDPADPYPIDKRNLHIKVFHKSTDRAHAGTKCTVDPLDYRDQCTPIDVHNYRIGAMKDPEIIKFVPTMLKIGPRILDLYHLLQKEPLIEHGNQPGKNLFFEIAHYRCPGGFIDKHTHFLNMKNGQKYNILTLLSEKGTDYEGGGLFFEYEGGKLDTTDLLTAGDTIIFKMDLVHWVTPVSGDKPRHRQKNGGRWSMGIFYY